MVKLVYAPLEPPVEGGRQVIAGIIGCLDVLTDDTTFYELKFVRGLTSEHELQCLLYAALLAVTQGRAASGVLFNARTGELVEKWIDVVAANQMLRAAAQAKLGLPIAH